MIRSILYVPARVRAGMSSQEHVIIAPKLTGIDHYDRSIAQHTGSKYTVDSRQQYLWAGRKRARLIERSEYCSQ